MYMPVDSPEKVAGYLEERIYSIDGVKCADSFDRQYKTNSYQRVSGVT